MLEKFRVKITLMATLIVTLCSYIYNKDFIRTCYIIIATIVIFYFLGGFIEIFLKNKIEEAKNITKSDDNNEENIHLEDEYI